MTSVFSQNEQPHLMNYTLLLFSFFLHIFHSNKFNTFYFSSCFDLELNEQRSLLICVYGNNSYDKDFELYSHCQSKLGGGLMKSLRKNI